MNMQTKTCEQTTEKAPHPIPGELLHERYLIKEVIGDGGFSIVYRAWDQLLYRDVAIKKFEYDGKSPQMERCFQAFLKEKELMLALRNIPYTPRILDEFSDGESEYIVQTLLAGSSLLDFMKENEGPLPASLLFPLLESFIYAVERMHKMGFIHRDISPKNLYMTKENKVYLIDFGSANALDVNSPLHNEEFFEHKGFHCPEYASPTLQGPWSDIYSLCASIVYLLTGSVVPPPESRMVYDEIPQLLNRCKLAPSQQNALLNGLQLDIEKRTITAKELRIALCQELYPSSSGWKVEYEAKTDIGNRPMNQDNLTVDGLFAYHGNDLEYSDFLLCQKNEIHLAAICDGVGGASAGELSAKAAIQALIHFLENQQKSDVLPEILLEELLDQMNEKIISLADKIGNTGTTVSILMWKGKHYYAANIGDSPIYLLHKRKLVRLSIPHTLAEKKKKDGLTYALSDRHVLLNYLGKRRCAGSQMMTLRCGHLEEGDTFLLCSDGVSEIIPDEKLQHYMRKPIRKAKGGIWKLLEKKENRDNCTTILLKFSDRL